jgi:2,3-bisphosphoglycerate-dependent phosphoglycerate mutase
MQTYIYMVRHSDSPKIGESERTRGLTEKGKRDAKRITELLKEFLQEETSDSLMTNYFRC